MDQHETQTASSSCAAGTRTTSQAGAHTDEPPAKKQKQHDSNELIRLAPVDTIVSVCAFLRTRELIRLRRISHHWAAASRQPLAWAPSVRSANQYNDKSLAILAESTPLRSEFGDEEQQEARLVQAFLNRLVATMPYLTALEVSVDDLILDVDAIDWRATIGALTRLRRLTLIGSLCALLPDLADLLAPRLRALSLSSDEQVIFPDDAGKCFGDLRLESLWINAAAWPEFFQKHSGRPLASTLRALRITDGNQIIAPARFFGFHLDRSGMTSFIRLNHLRIDARFFNPAAGAPYAGDENELKSYFRSLASLPVLTSLRLKSDPFFLCDDHLTPLLFDAPEGSTPLAPRLRFLSLDARMTPALFRRLAMECTALESLALVFEEWHRFEVAQLEAWRALDTSARIDATPAASSPLRLVDLLAAPDAFCLRLRFLHLLLTGEHDETDDGESDSDPAIMNAQLRRRFPLLMQTEEPLLRTADNRWFSGYYRFECDYPCTDADEKVPPRDYDAPLFWLPPPVSKPNI